jgi:predicted O-methyltransferase YrrM
MDLIKKGFIIFREEGLTVFIKKSSSYIFRKFIDLTGLGYILAPLIIRKFRRAIYNVNSIDDSVNFAFSFKYLGVSIKPSQVMYEITRLLELVERLKPKTILEIGTAGGGTLFLFTRVADPKATIISIDLPGGPFGGGYPRWKIPLYLSFSKSGQKIYLIRRDSHDPQTLEEVERILGGEKADFLFIDGDHTYEGVKKDFEMYSPLVRDGGIIAFHDIVPGPHECVGGVPKFWREVKSNYVSREIVKDWNQGGFSIGVIYV